MFASKNKIDKWNQVKQNYTIINTIGQGTYG